MDRWLRTSFLYTAATTMLVIGALYLAEHILAPLAVAVLLSIVLSGAVTRVETLGFGRWRLGRIAAVLVVAIGISAAFGGTGWIVVNEGSALVEQVPAYQRTLQGKIREPIDGMGPRLRVSGSLGLGCGHLEASCRLADEIRRPRRGRTPLSRGWRSPRRGE